MTVKRPKRDAGLTLIEVLTSSVILTIIILGTAAFRYNAALGAHKADLHIAAARTALLLCEAWRAATDANAFDPMLLTNSPDLPIMFSADGPAVPSGFTLLGSYTIAAEKVTYFATLSWKYDTPGSALRTLNVAVAWQHRGSGPPIFDKTDKVFKLTTYAEN